MSFTTKFVQRPVLAIVLSIVLVLLGMLAMRTRPISQFPEISPPRVTVSLEYPGASAEVLVQSSMLILERAVNGVPGMKYMTSDSTSAGEAELEVIFELGTDESQAMVNVKNRVDQVMTSLPILMQMEGVIVNRVQPSMLMYINLYSTEKGADQKFLFNFAYASILPELQRIKGVAAADILGSRGYAMRVWLNPDRMRAYKVSTEEVMKAIDDQSLIGRPGRLGQASGLSSNALEYTLTYKGRYNKPEEYENIILRANAEGEVIHLKDVATVELGSEFFDIYSNLDGNPSAAIVLKQTLGSNARDVIADVKAKLNELKLGSFPAGMDFKVGYDVSSFLDASIEKVIHTLGEAFVLVALVVFLFLGDWRSTLIPILAVPVSLIGTFLFMQIFGLTINLITLFALVLAIGIVVDNAIVVVEAVHAKMHDEHLSPYRAVQKVLGEITGAIIAITLMMTAVFVPVAFMSGPVGVFYRQFSITMAVAIVLSGFVALTLTPVLCAMLLKNNVGKPKRRTPISWALDGFNRGFDRMTGGYVRGLRYIVNRRLITFAMLAAFGFGAFQVSRSIPAGFVPGEDQGIIYAIIQTTPGTTLERTNAISRQLQDIAKHVDGVASVSALAGYEILSEGRGSNAGTCLINLKGWADRSRNVRQIIEELEDKSKDLGATIEYFEPPAVPGYGAAAGFSIRLLDKTTTTDYQEFDRINKEFVANLRKRKELTGLFSFYAANYPQYELVIDPALAMQKGVSVKAAMDNLTILVGSSYEQGFIRFNNYYKVYTQAAPEFRRFPSDIMKLYVKNEAGEMVPYSAFMTIKKTEGPNEIGRYNMYNSAPISGEAAAGFTSGDAIAAIRQVAAQTLPRGYDVAWEGLTFDEARRGNEAIYIFIVVLVFVYLVLAAQYESFLLPFAVVLSLPVGVFGSLLFLKLTGLANDVYAQVGLVMLVGLLGKNAVLIVEFAVQKHREGASVAEAAIEGAKVRFRPILMTSFAFIAGLIPLALATGPGAVANRTIGASALGGMLFGTVFGVIIVPGLYFIFGTLQSGRHMIQDEHDEPLTEEVSHDV